MSYGITVINEQGDVVVDVDISADRLISILGLIVKRSETVPDRDAAEPEKKKRRKRTGQRCGECGSKGRHYKWCTRTGQVAPKEEKTEKSHDKTRLTEQQFDEVKRLKDEGEMISTDIAKEMGVKVSEVNRAIFAKDYEEYANNF